VLELAQRVSLIGGQTVKSGSQEPDRTLLRSRDSSVLGAQDAPCRLMSCARTG